MRQVDRLQLDRASVGGRRPSGRNSGAHPVIAKARQGGSGERSCKGDRLLPDLTLLFGQLNEQLFDREIPAIEPTWSRRLTRTAGVFWWKQRRDAPLEYGIRLSLPLLGDRPLSDVKATLAHEMIHAWVSLHLEDLNHGHGVFFRTKMDQLNRQTSDFRVTRYHTFTDEVRRQAKYRWDCVDCGTVYRRQRNSINPKRHRCGRCRGKLLSVPLEVL